MNYDDLALKIWHSLPDYDSGLDHSIPEFAARLRAAWLEEMKLMAWIDPDLGPVLVDSGTYPFDVCVKNGAIPLYALPDAAPETGELK